MLVYRGEEILRGFDGDIRTHVQEEMIKIGVDVQTENDVTSIQKNDDGFEITLKDGTKRKTSCVMYATGRIPYVQGLGLDVVGVELGAKGEIKVDAYSQTSVENIYAVGDVTDRSQLTPVAIREGAAENSATTM